MGPSFLSSSIQLLPKITVIMTKEEIAEKLEEMKEHRGRKATLCHLLVVTTGKWTELLCAPESLMPNFLEEARSTVKD